MSDFISLKGIKGYGFHGVFESERLNGQDFLVDVELFLDLERASTDDELSNTVNYADIAILVVSEITGEPVKLIERLAGRIAQRILQEHSKVENVSVTVHKPDAPVGLELTDISVTITR